MTRPEFVRGLSVFVGPAKSRPPFAIEAVVIEQDCDLVLDTEPVIRDPGEQIETLLRAVETSALRKPGTIRVKGGSAPIEILAIVHDFSAEPSWREDWVVSALDAIFAEVAVRGIEALALPMLGSVHGRLSVARALVLLEQCLWRNRPAGLRSLWLLMRNEKDVARLDHWRDAGCEVARGQWPA